MSAPILGVAQRASQAARRLVRGPAGISAILVLLAATAFMGVAQGAPVATSAPFAGLPSAHGPAAVSWKALHPTAAPLGPLTKPPSYARGTFFTDTQIPYVNRSNQSCIAAYGGNCLAANVTNDPSMNLTSTGVLGMAYTAFTNLTPCGVQVDTETEIGFTASTDGGGNWSAPIYLGNTQCDASNESNFSNAWYPTLTSLGNGTLVLAYVQFNITAGYFSMIPYLNYGPYAYSVVGARLVVQESYNNGANWTTPTIVNSSLNPNHTKSWVPVRPWITATGNTVYLTWANETKEYNTNYATSPPSAAGSSQVHLLVSKNGGSSWGAPKDLPVVSTNNTTDFWAMDPTDLVLPNGDLVVAYATNLSDCQPCIVNGSFFYGYLGNLISGVSAINGSTIVAHAWLALYGWGANSYTQPMLAYSATNHQLYMASTLELPETVCTPYCYTTTVETVEVANSSAPGGVPSGNWSIRPVSSLTALAGGANSQLYNPSIGVNGNGVLDLEATVVNESMCAPYQYGSTCGAQNQAFTTSSDNGSSWTSAVSVGRWAFEPYSYDGEYSSLIAAGKAVYIGWTMENCPGFNGTGKYVWCDYPPPSSLWNYWNNGSATVQFSSLYEGVGLNVSFTETGLITGTHWTVNFGGNLREATAPGGLGITGVPPSVLNVSWTVNASSSAYGIRYNPTGTVASPSNFSHSVSINEHFDRQYLVTVSSVPYIPPYNGINFGCYGQTFWNNKYCAQVNYNLTPTPGSDWENAGATVPVNAYYNGNYCLLTIYCSYFYRVNLTFQSWSGNGNGSVNTSANATTLTANGPINETANFLYNAWCYVVGSSSTCVRSNASVTFVESGLPTGTDWGVSTWGPEANASTPAVNLGNTNEIAVTSPATTGVAYYSAWVVPGSSAGTWWVPSSTPASPVELPTEPVVDVSYSLSATPPASSTTIVQAVGLPTPSTQWGFGLDGTFYGQTNAETTFALSTGAHTFNATPVYLPNGTGYYPTAVDVLPFLVNGTWSNSTTVPDSVTLHGDAYVVVQYSPVYRVQASASLGGSVSSDVNWVPLGKTLNLTATTSAGYLFVGWTGTGAGSVTSTSPTISVSPSGPVQELASFRTIPPVRYTVTIDGTGLFAGEAFTVALGGVSYTGTSQIQVPNLLPGNYSFADQTVYANASSLTEFTPTAMTTTFATNGAGALMVGSDGYVNVTYAPQFALVVSSTGPGTTTMSGLTWEANGTMASITATPSAHYMLLGWNGSGTGAYTGTDLTIQVTLSAGPISEAAQFVYRPNPPPAVYRLTVQETGLPTGTAWGYGVAGTGASGAAGSGLTVTGLNGTYTLAVGIVPGATGVRYVPTNTAPSVPVLQNRSYNVTFVTQYLLTVDGGNGGTVTAVGGWYNASATVSLTATPASASYAFGGWNASTGASSPSASITVQMTGPVTETATFTAVYATPHNTGSSSDGMPLALGLLVALLAVGLIAGLVAGRRRRPPAEEAPEPMEQWQPDSSGEPAAESEPPAEGN